MTISIKSNGIIHPEKPEKINVTLEEYRHMPDDMNDIDPNDQNDKEDEVEEEDFATLFESYSGVMDEQFKVGDKITGRIISIGEDAVFVDTGEKSTVSLIKRSS